MLQTMQRFQFYDSRLLAGLLSYLIAHFQVGVKHIVLAVSYRAEMLEQEMKIEADKVF